MQRYFTLVARDVSARMAFTRVMRFFGKCPEYTRPHRDGSMRSHIHGRNRNRIALHVMLNGRRNFARWW